MSRIGEVEEIDLLETARSYKASCYISGILNPLDRTSAMRDLRD